MWAVTAGADVNYFAAVASYSATKKQKLAAAWRSYKIHELGAVRIVTPTGRRRDARSAFLMMLRR